jgi:hypothetical protein
VYTGQQDVPFGVTHVRIDRSVKIIPLNAFGGRTQLVSVETHDGIEKVEVFAFNGCHSLGGIKLPGVREVGYAAFANCSSLREVEFGNKLETIGNDAFARCLYLQKIKMPSVRTIQGAAFINCKQLTDVEMPAVERIGIGAFIRCVHLQRIAVPLKDNMFPLNPRHQLYTQFDDCENLATVDLVGIEKIRKTIASLLLESWRDEMNQEIDRINHVLPNTPADEKAAVIQEYIRSVISRMEHYKAEHNRLLKEDMTQLELAVWKAKLDDEKVENERDTLDGKAAKKTMVDVETARGELRITSGADINIIISNVLPFLQLLE